MMPGSALHALPDAHGAYLHEGKRHGTVLVWRQGVSHGAWEKIGPGDDLADALSGYAGCSDCYLSVNEFYGWRKVILLRSLRACFVDLDNCTSIDAALLAVDDACLPMPSYAVHSGRGVHLYWAMEPVGSQALPVWQAIQATLVKTLASVGADPLAKDCTRVLRLVGTINSKTGEKVWGRVITPGRWTLHQLADEVLGPREHIREVMARPKCTCPVRRAGRKAIDHYALWYRRYKDLCLIARHHGSGRVGVSEGHRDKLLFLLGVALSWFTQGDSLRQEIDLVARKYLRSLTSMEVAAYTQPIVDRAVAAAQGRTIAFNGQERDARFFFKTETIRIWLGDLLVPELEPRLQVLLPPEKLRERKRIRDASRWSQDRATYLESHAQERSKPWRAAGVSRATYFRRRAQEASPDRETGARPV